MLSIRGEMHCAYAVERAVKGFAVTDVLDYPHHLTTHDPLGKKGIGLLCSVFIMTSDNLVITSSTSRLRYPGYHGGVHRFSMEYLAVHPTVTLSIVDHYIRVAKDTKKRVVGVLLGEYIEGKTHATNSFAVPFEEDLRDPTLWYLDHNYLECMAAMFSKINKQEKIIGWYSTGVHTKPADLEINELFRQYTPHPMYLLVNVYPGTNKEDFPFNVYMSDDKPANDNMFRKIFVYVNSGTAQFEAEEVAVEHLLRDLEHPTHSGRSLKVADRLSALRCLKRHLDDITLYLQEVLDGSLPMHPCVFNNIQNIFNSMSDNCKLDLIQAFDYEINSSMVSLYVGSMIRAVLALHDLIKNRSDPRLTSKALVDKNIVKQE